jgi:hypothetical protein
MICFVIVRGILNIINLWNIAPFLSPPVSRVAFSNIRGRLTSFQE